MCSSDLLVRFGLNDLSDLPRVQDMAESLGIEGGFLSEHPAQEEQLALDDDGSAFSPWTDGDVPSDDTP